MKRCVLISGVPGSGKTTLMKKIIELLGGVDTFQKKEFVPLLVGMYKEGSPAILGVYDDSVDVFQGTDKLSMAVQPSFTKWINDELPSSEHFIVEGDRIVGRKTIDLLMDKGYDIQVYVLQAQPDVLKYRYDERGSAQNEQFLRAKETKVDKIASRMDLVMGGILNIVDHLTPDDTNKIANDIVNFLMEK